MERLLNYILTYPKTVLCIIGIIVIALGHRAFFLKQDNSPESFYAGKSEDKKIYENLVKTFGVDEVIIFQLRGAKLDNPKDLQAIARLTNEISQIKGVNKVYSVSEIYRDNINDPLDLPDSELVRSVVEEVNGISLYRVMGVARPDIPALGVVGMLTMSGPEARTELNKRLHQIEETFSKKNNGDAGYETLVAGMATANAALEREGDQTLTIFMPMVVVLVIIIGYALFRSFRTILVLAIPATGAVFIGAGVLEMSGETLNMMTAKAPPLVMVIGFAGAVHFITRYYYWTQNGLEHRQAVLKSFTEKLIPITLSFGATALGFIALAASNTHSIRVLGLVSGGSIIVALIFVIFGAPAGLFLLKPKIRMTFQGLNLFQNAAQWSVKNRWMVFGAMIIGIILFGVSLPMLNTSQNKVELLGENVPERVAYEKMEKDGMGLGNIDVWIHKEVPDYNALLKDAEHLEKIRGELEKIPLVTGVIHVGDLLKIYNMRRIQSPTLPESLNLLDLLDPEDKNKIDKELYYFWNKKEGLKVTLLTRIGSEDEVKEQKDRIRTALAKEFPGAKIDVSGQYLLLFATSGERIRTLAICLSVTVGVIAIILFLAFLSISFAAISMLTNLLPVALVIGLSGWMGNPIDEAMIMTGSIAFGIAVDNSFHFLYPFRQFKNIIKAAAISGPGILANALIVAGGFAVLTFSNFGPVWRFGIMTSIAVLGALFTDIFLMPALTGKRSQLEQISEKSDVVVSENAAQKQ
jgi:hypothetical protein